MASSHSGDDCHFGCPMLLLRDLLRLLHQHRPVALVLEFVRVSCMDRYHRPVHVQFPHQRAVVTQFRPKCIHAALSESEQSHEDILFWVLIGDESFPALVGKVVPSD